MTYRFFQNAGKTYGYDSVEQLAQIETAIAAGWEEVTGNWPPAPTSQELHQQLVASAEAALAKSDITVVRCGAAKVDVPDAWQTYRAALRAIVNGTDSTSTALPATPSYPSGT